MKLLEGLLLYEVVLLVLGVILFAALVGILIYSVIKKRSIVPLLLFFLIPVVMIGFPAIQKVRFDKDGVELEKQVKTAADQPPAETSPALTADLKAKIDRFKMRAANSPSALLTVARAETVIGDIAQSRVTLDQAIKLNPESVAAQDLKRRVDTLNMNTHATILRDAVRSNAALVGK
jgi:hypothetical protein